MNQKYLNFLIYFLFFIAICLLFVPQEKQDLFLARFNIILTLQNKQVIAVICLLGSYYFYNKEKLF